MAVQIMACRQARNRNVRVEGATRTKGPGLECLCVSASKKSHIVGVDGVRPLAYSSFVMSLSSARRQQITRAKTRTISSSRKRAFTRNVEMPTPWNKMQDYMQECKNIESSNRTRKYLASSVVSLFNKAFGL